MSNHPSFRYHPRCSKLGITHLAYADDLILLSRGEPTSVQVLLNCLDHFASCSGLHINHSKSSILCAAMGEEDIEYIRNSTGFQLGQLPFRYLGIPIHASRLTYAHFASFFEKISGYINKWLGKTLSYAERIELIKSILQGIDCFFLSFLPIPSCVIDKIDSLSRVFLFGDHAKFPPVAWGTVCKPKKEGGMGLLCLNTWNMALLSSHLWNFHLKKDTLWVKWVSHYYMNNESVWTWNPIKDISPLMRKLIVIRGELEKHGGMGSIPQLFESWYKHGKVQVFNVYEYLRGTRRPVWWSRLVWASVLTPRISFFLWLALLGKLQTKDMWKGENLVKICPICKNYPENIDHIFFACVTHRQVWRMLCRWLGISMPQKFHDITKVLYIKYLGEGTQRAMVQACFGVAVYHLWRNRNVCLHEGVGKDSLVMARTIQRNVYEMIYSKYPHLVPFGD
ncbi:hypothetical protein Dimus_038030 [Dionaea muscipula]